MSRYRYLLIDLDDTLVSFHKTFQASLKTVFRRLMGRDIRPEELDWYEEANTLCWKQLERKEITKEILKHKRFAMLSEHFGLGMDDEMICQMNEAYMEELSRTVIYMPGTQEFVRYAAERYRLIVITNGTDWVQHGRLSRVSFAGDLAGVVISDEIGVNKPDPRFFDGVTAITGDSDKSRYLVIGDSETSDIAFGRAVGLDTLRLCGADAETAAMYRACDWDGVIRILEQAK